MGIYPGVRGLYFCSPTRLNRNTGVQIKNKRSFSIRMCNIWDLLVLKKCSLLIWNSNKIYHPVLYLETLILNLLNMSHLWFNEKGKKEYILNDIHKEYIVLDENTKICKKIVGDINEKISVLVFLHSSLICLFCCFWIGEVFVKSTEVKTILWGTAGWGCQRVRARPSEEEGRRVSFGFDFSSPHSYQWKEEKWDKQKK